MNKPLVEYDRKTKKTTLNFHAGQRKAYYSLKRIIAIIAGSRSGKTSFGPWWLIKEMKLRGPGTYMVVAPSFGILDKGAAPEINLAICEQSKLGKMVHGTSWQIVINRQGKKALFGDANAPSTRILFGHADNPDTLEAITAKAAWLDEAGQKRFKLGSWEAIRRRLSIDRGRVLITTNPYGMTWLKTEIYDQWHKMRDEGKDHPDIDFINFDSTMNPAFPREEWLEAKARLPPWKFDLYHRGIFTRPAGLIYDAFDPDTNIISDFPIPTSWRRYLGLDFGGVNTVGVFFAKCPTSGVYYGYREYHAGGKTAREHTVDLLSPEPGIPYCVGGAKSEGQWRDEFRASGLPVREPDQPLVDVGITRVYGALKERKVVLFASLVNTIEQFNSYSREVDDEGETTEAIEDKETYHYCFVAGTKIATSQGDLPIEKVRIGMMAWTRDGWRRVVGNSIRRGQKTNTVEMSNGSVLVGTPDHPIWVEGSGMTTIDSIRYGDKVLVCDQKSLHSMALNTAAIQTHLEGVIGFTSKARNSNTFTERFGRSILALFQKGSISTTLMKTLSTTISEIWNARRTGNTSLTTTEANARLRCLPTSTESGRLQRSGMPLLKAGSGTGSMAKMSSPQLSQRYLNAQYARSRSRVRQWGTPDSVVMPVSLSSEGDLALMTKREFANAASPLLLIDTPPSNTVPVYVQQVVEAGVNDVYNLTVEDAHEYYANGILVSNCDAIRYIIGWEFRESKTDWRSVRIDNPFIGTDQEKDFTPQISRVPRASDLIRRVCS